MLGSFGQRSRGKSTPTRRAGRFLPRLDVLEDRLAPATLVNPNTVTYVNTDSEQVTVTIDKPVFDLATINEVFDFNVGQVDADPTNDTPRLLQLVDLSNLVAGGATLTATSNDGFANLDQATIEATGLDLAAIKIVGALRGVNVGDADLATPALGRFVVNHLGGPTGATPSQIQGSISLLKVKGEIGNAFLDVNGSLGTAVIGGLIGGGIDTARIRVTGDIVSMLIEGDMDASGNGARSAFVEAGGSIASITVLGDMVGVNATSARIFATSSLGKVKVGGNLQGGNLLNSGTIEADGDIGVVKIGVSLLGGNGVESGRIAAGGSIGKVSISGNLNAGTGNLSGMIGAEITIGEVFIGGTVAGLVGQPARIVVQGFNNPTDPAIGLVTIQGNMIRGQILAGYDPITLQPEDADQRIGKVKIGFSFQQSLIAAGVDPQAGGLFADANDTVFDEPPDGTGGEEPPISRIDKVVIGSAVGGTATADDHFGIVAQEIGVVKLAGVPLVLTTGPSNDVIELLPNGTNDVTLREV